jgi:GNAT superfamily N-acetyltransferase
MDIGVLSPQDLSAVLAEHHRFWADRDLRALHLYPLIHQFPDTCLAARRADGVISAYLLGFVTPAAVGYIHLVAVRDDARGEGLGRRLYTAFAERAAGLGATSLEAITTPANTGSIAFHQALGFDHVIVNDYAGPGSHRVVFTRPMF